MTRAQAVAAPGRSNIRGALEAHRHPADNVGVVRDAPEGYAPVLAQLSATRRIEAALADAVPGLIGSTVFTGRTCSALTAGVVALGAVLGTLERSRLRVLRMIGLMAVSGDAFADKYMVVMPPCRRGLATTASEASTANTTRVIE
jgi:hypothetical protein